MKKSAIINLINEYSIVLIGLGVNLYREDNLPESYNSWDVIKKYNESYNSSEINNTLNNLFGDKDYFIITTSWDSNITESFDSDRVYTPSGNCKKLRCYNSCHEELWDYDMFREKDSGVICPYCGSDLVMNISVDAFFINNEYREQEDRFHHWLHKHYNDKILIMEWEASDIDRRYINDPFENIATALPNVTLLRINSQDIAIPEVIKSTVLIQEKPNKFIEKIQ